MFIESRAAELQKHEERGSIALTVPIPSWQCPFLPGSAHSCFLGVSFLLLQAHKVAVQNGEWGWEKICEQLQCDGGCAVPSVALSRGPSGCCSWRRPSLCLEFCLQLWRYLHQTKIFEGDHGPGTNSILGRSNVKGCPWKREGRVPMEGKEFIHAPQCWNTGSSGSGK